MKKQDLVRMVSQKTNIAQKYCKIIIEAYADCIIEALLNDDNDMVWLGNLGYFRARHVAERKGTTTYGANTEWYVPAHNVLDFKVTHKAKSLLWDDNMRQYKAGNGLEEPEEPDEAMEDEE